ncbi:hypothetical protein ACE6H2_026821 [Prunus campanulata]
MVKVKKEQLQEEVVDPHEKMGFLLQALYDTEGCFDSPTSKPSSATRRATGPMRRSAKFWTEEERWQKVLNPEIVKGPWTKEMTAF